MIAFWKVRMDESKTNYKALRAQAFENSDLKGFSLKERVLIHLADIGFFIFIQFIGMTLRYEVEGQESLIQCEAANKLPIISSWHDAILATTHFLRNRNIIVMVSQSRDGAYMARCIHRFGYGAARGSSTRGGLGAFVEMVRLMRAGFPGGFTVDGPKGPRHIVKPGACLLAKKTGSPLIPFVIVPKHFWEVSSWDRLQIPVPFSKAKVFIGEPIFVSPEADENALEEKRAELQHSLDELVKRGVQWRPSKN